MASFTLGYISATPGVPIRITNNESDPTKTISCNSILIQTLSTSVSRVWIGKSNMDKNTGTGVLAVLAVPTANSIPSYSMGNPGAAAGFSPSEFYIDSTSSASGVLASYVR